jgi:hypothetical protein
MIVAIGTLLVAVTTSRAQEQESKLIDRILKPDMELSNSAQNKQFNNTRAASFDKQVTTRAFSSSSKTLAKTFPDERAFTPQQFAARHFRAGDSSANISPRSQLKNGDTIVATPAASAGTRVAPVISTAPPATRDYAGSRPFLDQGKSQKSLSAQNKPLTIEQVRELLNKSK